MCGILPCLTWGALNQNIYFDVFNFGLGVGGMGYLYRPKIDISMYRLDLSRQTSRGGLLVGIFHHGFGVQHEDGAWLIS